MQIILGLKKDLRTASNNDKKGAVQEWSTAIVNHIYWVASSTLPTTEAWADVVEAKWRSLLNHIVNKHQHQDPLYPRCQHPRVKKKGAKKKKFMKEGKRTKTLLLA